MQFSVYEGDPRTGRTFFARKKENAGGSIRLKIGPTLMRKREGGWRLVQLIFIFGGRGSRCAVFLTAAGD